LAAAPLTLYAGRINIENDFLSIEIIPGSCLIHRKFSLTPFLSVPAALNS
jgi:hypothetical protein